MREGRSDNQILADPQFQLLCKAEVEFLKGLKI